MMVVVLVVMMMVMMKMVFGGSPTSIVLENETTPAAGEPVSPHLDHSDLDKTCSFNESSGVT